MKINKEQLQEIIKKELSKIHEGELERIKKDWGGEGEPSEEFDAEEFFGSAGDAAEEDIKAEFGEDEFAPFGTLEDPRMLKDLDEDEEPGQPGLFKPQDAEGNDINIKALVKHIGSNKSGRVLGLGDDGKGSLIVRVDWAWPVDMKFTDPKEMGEKREAPEHLIVQNAKSENMNEELNEKINQNLNHDVHGFSKKPLLGKYIYDIIHNPVADQVYIKLTDEPTDDSIQNVGEITVLTYYADENKWDFGNLPAARGEQLPEDQQMIEDLKDVILNHYEENAEETIDESGRGLGAGVKNSGDRNVKLRDDHHSAPLTNLNESVNKSIKNLFEGKVTKNILKEFISEEAKKVAKKLKG